jgi:hypothetical protein
MDVHNGEPRRTIPLKKFLTDYRSLLDDRQIMEKYGLSARSFVNLIKSLVQKNLITAQDLAKRREVAVQRDMVKESQFLSSLYICTHCSHPSPTPFKICPACGVDSEVGPAADDISDEIQTQGSNIYLPPTQVLEAKESTAASKRPGNEKQSPSEPGSGEENGSSALVSVRSFFSKLKKK